MEQARSTTYQSVLQRFDQGCNCDSALLNPTALISPLPLQCNCFHPVDRFFGTQRSCRVQLERRRQRRLVSQLASSTPHSEEAPMGARPRRAAALHHRLLVPAGAGKHESSPEPEGSPPLKRSRRLAAPAGQGADAAPALSSPGASAGGATAGGAPAPETAQCHVVVEQRPAGAANPPPARAHDGGPDLLSCPAGASVFAAVAMASGTQPIAASLLSSLLGPGSSEGVAEDMQDMQACQASPQLPALAPQDPDVPVQPPSTAAATGEPAGRSKVRTLLQQLSRRASQQPAAARQPAPLAQPAVHPDCLPPLGLQARRPQLRREEAQAQLATAAVVMALALAWELAEQVSQQL